MPLHERLLSTYIQGNPSVEVKPESFIKVLSGFVILFLPCPHVYLSIFPVFPSGLLLNPITDHRLRAKTEGFILPVVTRVYLRRYLQTWFKESPGDWVGAGEGNKWKAANKPSSTNALLSHRDTLSLCGKATELAFTILKLWSTFHPTASIPIYLAK